uniref:Uncharacterized protein n=1 Tax=Hyaloperonospora arabidopsidis (strain Emoy2) TaxID=559515 RepID=M4B2E6_HYAAE
MSALPIQDAAESLLDHSDFPHLTTLDVSPSKVSSTVNSLICVGEPQLLRLRRHIAVQARQLPSEFERTHFLLSKMTGKTKEWALGNLVADPGCFPDL